MKTSKHKLDAKERPLLKKKEIDSDNIIELWTKSFIEDMQWFSFQDIIFCTANNNKSLAKHLQKLLKVF